MSKISHVWSHIQTTLFPFLEEELDPLTGKQKKLVVPMLDQDEQIIGVLQLINAQAWDEAGRPTTEVISFDSLQEEMTRSLASQAAVAISNARLTASIKGAVEGMEGVTQVEVDVDNKSVKIEHQGADEADLRKANEKAGYHPSA